MLNNNLALYGIKFTMEIVLEILYFPVWWYSQGLLLFVKKLLVFLSNQQKSLAMFVWIKNIFKPMYGQTDWQGIMISILMRIVQIAIRSVAMLFYLIIALSLLAAWLFLPMVVIYQIFYQLV